VYATTTAEVRIYRHSGFGTWCPFVGSIVYSGLQFGFDVVALGGKGVTTARGGGGGALRGALEAGADGGTAGSGELGGATGVGSGASGVVAWVTNPAPAGAARDPVDSPYQRPPPTPTRIPSTAAGKMYGFFFGMPAAASCSVETGYAVVAAPGVRIGACATTSPPGAYPGGGA
jgi:hypothetical protein